MSAQVEMAVTVRQLLNGLIKEKYMRYAIIQEGVCVNIVKSDAVFAQTMGWIPLPDGFGIGDRLTGGTFSHPLPESETQEHTSVGESGTIHTDTETKTVPV